MPVGAEGQRTYSSAAGQGLAERPETQAIGDFSSIASASAVRFAARFRSAPPPQYLAADLNRAGPGRPDRK